MGALEQHFEELEVKHNIIVNDLKLKLQHVEMELDDITERYESLCGMVRKSANGKRNGDDWDLTNYNTDGDFWS